MGLEEWKKDLEEALEESKKRKLKDSLNLAFSLRKEGVSLKKIECKTGIPFRDLSVIFKYVDKLNEIELKDLENEKKALEDLITEKNKTINELKDLINKIEKEKENLALNLKVQKFNLKVISPIHFLLVVLVAFLIGIFGSFVAYSKLLVHLEEKEAVLSAKEEKLNKKEIELKKQQIYINKQYKQLNKLLDSLTGNKK